MTNIDTVENLKAKGLIKLAEALDTFEFTEQFKLTEVNEYLIWSLLFEAAFRGEI